MYIDSNIQNAIIIILFICLLITIIVLITYYYNITPYNEQYSEDVINFYNTLSMIYIINLERYPKRYEYVTSQLNNLGLKKYQKWNGTDGFFTSIDDFLNIGLTTELCNRKGLAGCASSHIGLWRHIAENKLDWVLILEDDAHFHPDFVKLFNSYVKNIEDTDNVMMIFPGYCGNDEIEKSDNPVIEAPVMCLHGYIISHRGAQYLLDNLLPMNDPVDIAIIDHFHKNKYDKCLVFNGNASIDGIRPHDYKEQNGSKCQFSGIIYQNQKEKGSTIHSPEIVY